MTEQTPEIVAAVDVSPVSPKPIHTTATSPALVPSLQDHAAALDVAYLDSLTTAPFPFVTMPATRSANPAPKASEDAQSSPVSDTIVVRGDEDSDASQDEDEAIDDESLDAYGEDDEEQQDDAGSPQSSHVRQLAESGTGDGTGTEKATARPDVTEESSESMINTPSAESSPDQSNVLMRSESPAVIPSHPAESGAPIASIEGRAQAPDANRHPGPKPQTVADNRATTSDAAAAAIPAHVEHQEDSAGVDIQKLVDSITAGSVASSSSATTAPQALPEAPPSSVKPAAQSISLPQSSSLPPKPAIPQQKGQPGSRPEDFHPFPSRGANNSHGAPPMPMQGVVHSHAVPNASISYMAGAASEGISSLPPIPQTSFNGGSDHYASLPSVMSVPGAGASQREGLHGAQLQQAWEAFQDDEKRYMTEAKWERFPDNSRIFIGECSTPQLLHALVTCG